MRWFSPAAVLLLLALAGCAGQHSEETASAPFPASPIIVHEFAVSPGGVMLDPTLGYSLHRGMPGVPPQQRAEALGRAAAFNLADAMSRELRRLGYDVVTGEDAAKLPVERALVVSGDFRQIFEGHRHEGAGVSVAVAIDYQSAGTPGRRLIAFALDSRRLPREGLVPVAGRHGEDVNYEATRLGAVIGRYVADLAKRDRWPAR
jgi:hypothetical protein